jgi:hypothetical protein
MREEHGEGDEIVREKIMEAMQATLVWREEKENATAALRTGARRPQPITISQHFSPVWKLKSHRVNRWRTSWIENAKCFEISH